MQRIFLSVCKHMVFLIVSDRARSWSFLASCMPVCEGICVMASVWHEKVEHPKNLKHQPSPQKKKKRTC